MAPDLSAFRIRHRIQGTLNSSYPLKPVQAMSEATSEVSSRLFGLECSEMWFICPLRNRALIPVHAPTQFIAPPPPTSRDRAPGSQVNRGQDLPANKPPQDWPWAENPPDIYFNYYVWANLHALNGCRHARGLNSFQYHPRPSPAFWKICGDCLGWS